MAERALAPRQWNEPPVVTVVASAQLPGVTARLVRNEPAIFDTGPWPEVRVIMQTSRPAIRAACRCDGHALDRMQVYRDFIIQPAGTPGVWRDYQAAEMLVLNLTPAFLRRTAEGLDLDPDKAGFTPWLHARDPQVEHIGLAIKAGLEGEGGLPPLYGESLSVALAARLMSRFGSGVRVLRQGLSHAQRRRVLEHVEANLDGDLSLTELAAAARISVPHFTTLFRRTMGRSAHRYVIERRVAAATALLRNGRQSIAEVALETGFAHQSHLTRHMRKLTGCSPGEIVRSR